MVKTLCSFVEEPGRRRDGFVYNVLCGVLHHACTIGQVVDNIVHYLCSLDSRHKVDVSSDNNLALQIAVENHMYSIVRMLCDLPPERGVDVIVDNWRLIQYAMIERDVSMLQILLVHLYKRGIYLEGMNEYTRCNKKRKRSTRFEPVTY